VKNLFIPNKGNGYKPILLRKVALVFYTVILLLVNTFGGLLGIPQAMASSITPANIIQLTNQQRASMGLNTLNSNAKLAAAAQAKANNMFEVQYWDHFGPNGESPWMFISQAGYAYVYAGENLAKGFRTAEGVHEAWMASPTHKANIISPNYKDIGVAVVQGTLLGTDTILVVQMFGNLTSDVYKPASEPTVAPTPAPAKPVIKESGEIKSIRITSPKANDLINDANVNIKGETTNITGEYTVEILNQDQLVGEVNSSTASWEFDKGSDWEEGEKKIAAQVKGESIKSESVVFTIDSTPPQILQEGIKVKRDDTSFELRFDAPEGATEIKLILGDETIELKPDSNGEVVFSIPSNNVGDKAVLMASDYAGNISQLDISEYFIDEEEEEDNFANRFMLGVKSIFTTTDGISLTIVAFIFLLLSIEVYVVWKKGKLGKNIGELFTIGAWWLIILVGVFKGFGGVIN
jgi:hypothetical protein